MVFSFLSLSFCFELHSFTGRAGNTARPSCRLPGRLGRLWASRLLRHGLAVAYSGPSPPPGKKKRNSGSWEKAGGGGGTGVGGHLLHQEGVCPPSSSTLSNGSPYPGVPSSAPQGPQFPFNGQDEQLGLRTLHNLPGVLHIQH